MSQKNKWCVFFALAIVGVTSASPVLAAGVGKQDYISSAPVPTVSKRLIVKLRASKTAKIMSVAQIRGELSRPFAVQAIQRMQVAAGASLADGHALGNGAHVMSLNGMQDAQSVAQAIAGIGKLPEVEYVEEDRMETIRAIPDDALYADLWGMQPVSAVVGASPGLTGSYGADFETAWNTSTGVGVVVAVVDTGIMPHPDIVGINGTVYPATGNLISSGYDFITDCRERGSCAASTADADAYVAPSPNATDTGDFVTAADSAANPTFFPSSCLSDSSWHGTHVAGTVAAIGNNATGVIGGAYGAKILPVRALGKCGGFMSDISEGILWAAGVHPTIANPNPARVINLSLGSSGSCSATRQDAINAAVAAGAVVVVAAGNDNQDVAYANSANCLNVISVAAVARDGSRAVYSNYSSPSGNPNPKYVTLAAPGSNSRATAYDPGIWSTVDSGKAFWEGASYTAYVGTSMATPHVSAAVALMLARNPALTPAQVKAILSSPASLTAFPTFAAFSFLGTRDCSLRHNCGEGILNANLALQNSLPAFSLTSGSLNFGTVAGYTTGNSKTITLTNILATPVTATSVSISGPNAPMFSVVLNTCMVPVAPANTCQITVNFYPNSSSGVYSATLSVLSTDGGAIIDIAGQAGAALTVPASLVNAPAVAVGQSTTVILPYTNPNSFPVLTGSFQLTNPAIMAVSSDTCSNVSLAAGASCSATITITPIVSGNFMGAVSLRLSSLTAPTAPSVDVNILGVASSAVNPSASTGGGGCSIMPPDATPDASLLLALLALLLYRLTRRNEITRRDE